MIDVIESGLKPAGNTDLVRKSLYERHYAKKFNVKLNKDEECFSGCLFLEHERIDDVYLDNVKSYRRILEDYYNLNIFKSFGLSLDQYLDRTPKELSILNEIAIKKLKEMQNDFKDFT